MSINIGVRLFWNIGATLVIQVQAGTKTLSPSFRLNFSLIAAINKELAVEPDDTNNECLAPTHLDQRASNCLTFGQFVNLFDVKTKDANLIFSEIVMALFISSQDKFFISILYQKRGRIKSPSF